MRGTVYKKENMKYVLQRQPASKRPNFRGAERKARAQARVGSGSSSAAELVNRNETRVRLGSSRDARSGDEKEGLLLLLLLLLFPHYYRIAIGVRS